MKLYCTSSHEHVQNRMKWPSSTRLSIVLGLGKKFVRPDPTLFVVFFLCLLFVIGMLQCAYRRYKYKIIHENLNLVAFAFDVSASQCIS
jgi:hypothetical protein